ncbi:uncharacterized protein [Dermacentor andersoni]|uniref:uncharacterized protein n=1 Tax=Dermacentor andersoni TaxID=34620 RepID=UPI003B3A0C5C
MFCSGGTGSRVLQLTRLDSSHVHALCSCPPIQEEISPRDLGLENSRRQHPLCNTSGCLWLRGYLRSGDSNSNNIQSQRRSRAGPCDDFHEHVCRSRPQSIYEDGVARLMDAVKARLLGMRIGAGGNASDATKGTSERERQREPASLLRRCLDGATVVTGDDIASACGDVHGMVCPNAAPEAPLRISESFFQNNPNASVDDYAAFVKRRPQLEEALAPDSGEDFVQAVIREVDAENLPLGGALCALRPGAASSKARTTSRSAGPVPAALEGPLLRATHGEQGK